MVAKVRGPADVAVMIPYLMGFQPEESLVVVALEGPRKQFGPVLRVDLVADERLHQEIADRVVAVLDQNGVRCALVAAYSDRPDRADPVVRPVLDGLGAHGIRVEDAFRTNGHRWWSYTCSNPSCCSPDGMPYDAGTSRVAAEAVVSGMSFAADRDALRSQFDPDAPDIRNEVAKLVMQRRDPSPQAVTAALVPARVSAVLAAPAEMSALATAGLAVAVQTVSGTQRAMALVDRTNAEAHFEVWRTVLRRVPDALLPPVGCLAAFCAWLDGRGVLASHAIDRVQAVTPEHPLAGAIAALLDGAVNPRTWPGPPAA